MRCAHVIRSDRYTGTIKPEAWRRVYWTNVSTDTLISGGATSGVRWGRTTSRTWARSSGGCSRARAWESPSSTLLSSTSLEAARAAIRRIAFCRGSAESEAKSLYTCPCPQTDSKVQWTPVRRAAHPSTMGCCQETLGGPRLRRDPPFGRFLRGQCPMKKATAPISLADDLPRSSAGISDQNRARRR